MVRVLFLPVVLFGIIANLISDASKQALTLILMTTFLPVWVCAIVKNHNNTK